ncbi:MAG: DUF3127 domain-containing protein [Armatimonadia bacterium]
MSEKNRFDLTGTLNRIDRFETKAGKTMLTLILDVDKGSKYPQVCPVKIFGRTADMASDWHTGDVLEITGRLGGRDWNGRVFGDIVAESVEVVSKAAAPSPAQGELPTGNAPPESDDCPF